MACTVLVRGGSRAVEEALEELRRLIYRYNERLRGTGYYLKPVHIVTKRVDGDRRRYVYVGRYWWRLRATSGRRGSRVKWSYIGREMPPDLRGKVPPPPTSRLAGLRYVALDNGDIIVPCDIYKRFKWLFQGLRVEPLDEGARRLLGDRAPR